MKTIKDESKNLYEEKKSRFIAYSFSVGSKEDVDKRLDEISKENVDAKHLTYAFNLKTGLAGASEDKEPISSMHRLLSLLQSKEIINTLIIVVRYYGGVLLGASHLDRVYFQLGTDLIKDDKIRDLSSIYYYKGTVLTSYYPKAKELISKEGKVISSDFMGKEVEVEFYLFKEDQGVLDYFKTVLKTNQVEA